MRTKIIKEKITREELKNVAGQWYDGIVKAVVDIEREIMAVGGEFHADANVLLIEQGSNQENLWGINIYPDRTKEEWIEFSALINIRPSLGNRSMEIENPEIKEKIKKIVNTLIQ